VSCRRAEKLSAAPGTVTAWLISIVYRPGGKAGRWYSMKVTWAVGASPVVVSVMAAVLTR
jgi:hypothetical protein